VTIFGESAGSMDVNTLVTMPMSKGLFARAIAESGAAGDAQSLADAEKEGEALANKLNITGDGALAKLRAASSEDLVKASSQGPMIGLAVPATTLPHIA
jgi:para-nitrobenzyl esterase